VKVVVVMEEAQAEEVRVVVRVEVRAAEKVKVVEEGRARVMATVPSAGERPRRMSRRSRRSTTPRLGLCIRGGSRHMSHHYM
jgi:hypothetical protein